MALNPQEALDRYEELICFITRKCPKFWNQDAKQDLRLRVLQLCKVSDGKLDDYFVKINLLNRFRAFEKSERNRGVVYAPNNAELEFLNVDDKRFNLSTDRRNLKVDNHL